MQVVGYRPRTEDPPALRVASNGTVREESLAQGTDLSYTLTNRHCAGAVDDDVHVACQTTTAPYCDVHADRWPCARCTGDCRLPIEACREEHAVYLAGFAPDTFKVGVTRSWRLERRLREQGADVAAHLRTVANGRIAREIEGEIASAVGDRVRVPAKIAGLHHRVDVDAWEALLAEFAPIEAYDFDYDLDLSDRPLPETLAAGTVVGSQGRVVIIAEAGSTYAVDLRDLVGYELDADGGGRTLQSSLGAFGE